MTLNMVFFLKLTRKCQHIYLLIYIYQIVDTAFSEIFLQHSLPNAELLCNYMGIHQLSLNNRQEPGFIHVLRNQPKTWAGWGGELWLSSFMLPEFTFIYIAFISWWIAWCIISLQNNEFTWRACELASQASKREGWTASLEADKNFAACLVILRLLTLTALPRLRSLACWHFW